jgi:predicted PurR-regulated permease PerM
MPGNLEHRRLVKLFDKKTAQALLTALVFTLTLLFLYSAWRSLIAFLFAVFFAYLLEAPVSQLQKWLRGSRGGAIAIVYLIFIGALVIAFSLVGPPIAQEAQTLMKKAPELVEKNSLESIVENLGARHGWGHNTVQGIQEFLEAHKGDMVTATQNLIVRAVKTIQGMWWLLLVPLLGIFFLKDGSALGQNLINSFEDEKNRQIASETATEMNSMLGHFLRAQLTLSGLAMVVVTFVLWIMRVPYAFALGPAAGAMEFVPVVGPLVGGAIVIGVAFLAGYSHLWWLLIVLVIWRGIQDYVSSPRILGKTLELHPLAVLFGVLAGGEVAGVIGVFLSIPVLATLRILWHAWHIHRKSGQQSAA